MSDHESDLADLESLSRVLVQSTVIVHDVNKLEIVPRSTSIIIRVVCWGYFDSTGPKRHVDYYGISHDRKFAGGDEGVTREFAMEVLIPQIVGMNGNCSISQHCFRTCRGNYDAFLCFNVSIIPLFS